MSTRTSRVLPLNFARGPDSRAAPQSAADLSYAALARWARRHHAHHFRHGVCLRGHGLDNRQRGRGANPVGQAHARGLRDTPIIDRTCCVLMANNEIVLDLLENGEYERAKQVVGWCVWAAKAFGIKAVNPGGVAGWKWGRTARGCPMSYRVTRRSRPRR